jgi:dihydropteroate synthase
MRWGNRILDFAGKPFVMGILNCTPDSFYPGSRKAGREASLRQARKMIAEGADIIDIGGESSRPGSEPIAASEEMERVCPVIEGIRGISEILLSIDTTKARVAEQALKKGCDIVNDISALRSDPEMKALISEKKVPVVLMHMRGIPRTMQESPFYRDTLKEIKEEMGQFIDTAVDAGISRKLIIIDPGIGFGKRQVDNLRILKGLPELRSFRMPILIGLSRKSFIGNVLGLEVEQRLIGTVAANTVAMLNGADIVRVHDVAEAVEMVGMVSAIRDVEM